MERRRAVGVAAAIAAGAATMMLLTPGVAVGKQSASEPRPHPSDRVELCHFGKTIKVYPGDLEEHLAHGDTTPGCPKG